MTNEEIQQVQAYIQKLTAEHAFALQTETTARKLAQDDNHKMAKAVMAIWELAHANQTMLPMEFAANVRQAIQYFAPDFDIPF